MWEFFVTTMTAASPVIVGVFIGVLSAQIPWYLQRKTAKAEDHGKRKALLGLFAREAVYLQSRWVQYRRQAPRDEMSLSRPYEITDGSHLAELIRLGASEDLVISIYKVKQLNADVLNQIIRAQGEFSAAALHNEQRNGMAIVQTQYLRSFKAASAFIDDEWVLTKGAINEILEAAKDAGVDINSMTHESRENEKEYQTLVEAAEKRTRPAD